MKIDFELIEKQNLQITTKMRIYYYMSYVILPTILFGFISSLFNIWVLVFIVVAFLFFHRSYLDMPSQSSVIDFGILFRPIKSTKARIKLMRPNENDLKTFPQINILFRLFIVCYIIIQLTTGLIFFFMLVILFKDVF